MYSFEELYHILYYKGGYGMDADFVRDRITQLRLQKGVSEYKMSYDLGHSRGYINNISSGKTLPSMAEFFIICEYFGITPVDFFNEKQDNPNAYTGLVKMLESLDKEDFELVYQTVKRLAEK